MIVAQCPQRDDLYEYSVGRLSDAEYATIAAHLERCRGCQAELMTLDDDGDTLVRQLRQRVDDSSLQEPVFHAAVARARAIPRNGGWRQTGSQAELPRMLGEYELLEEIGRGGMGRVYKARHTKLDRIVAIKILPRGRLENRQSLARFEREMRAIGRLDHPHVVHAYDAREIDQMPVLVMEYVDGLDLAELVRRLGRLKPEDACFLVQQAALGLQYAHANGLVHRDIKPSNLMLARDGQVKLLDLGLARFYGEPLGEEVTGAGQAMGTADYVAPEQVGDSRRADIRADIYSLGCTLYKLLCGRAPYASDEYRSAHEKMNAHLHQPLPPIAQHVGRLPTALTTVIERMLAKDPAERFATPAELVDVLAPLCAGGDAVRLVEEAERAESPAEHEFSGGDSAAGFDPDPRVSPLAQRRKPWQRLVVAIALGLCAVGVSFAAGVTLTINKDGRSTQVELPQGARASVSAAGDVTVTLPDGVDDMAVSPPTPAARQANAADDDPRNSWIPVAVDGELSEGWEMAIQAKADDEESDSYKMWIEGGWLYVRRLDRTGALDWQVKLARGDRMGDPNVSTHDEGYGFHLSSEDGRYFIRESKYLLRAGRQRSENGGAIPRASLLTEKATSAGHATLYATGVMLSGWRDDSWSYVASGPDKDYFDLLVRLDATKASRFAYQAIYDLAYVHHDDATVWDDGELLVASRPVNDGPAQPEVGVGTAVEEEGEKPMPTGVGTEAGDFTFTEVHTDFSEQGVPALTRVAQVKVSGAHKRTEHPGGTMEIVDALTGRGVVLDPHEKIYRVFDRLHVFDLGDGTHREHGLPTGPVGDHYARLVAVPEGAEVERLPGEERIQGQRSRGVRFTQPTPQGRVTTTLWKSTETGKLVQSQSEWTFAGEEKAAVFLLRTGFDYQPALDKSLFSLVPPPGYTLETAAVLGLTPASTD